MDSINNETKGVHVNKATEINVLTLKSSTIRMVKGQSESVSGQLDALSEHLLVLYDVLSIVVNSTHGTKEIDEDL